MVAFSSCSIFLQIDLALGFGGLLVGEGLGVLRTFCGRIRDKVLILCLSILLVDRRLLDLFVEFRFKLGDHRHDAVTSLSLFLVVPFPGLWHGCPGRNVALMAVCGRFHAALPVRARRRLVSAGTAAPPGACAAA